MTKESWREGAQQAVNVVAPMVAGQSREAVTTMLDQWLTRLGATLPEPRYSQVVRAIAEGNDQVIILPM